MPLMSKAVQYVSTTLRGFQKLNAQSLIETHAFVIVVRNIIRYPAVNYTAGF